MGPLTREQLSKLLTETDVYVKYGLHDKALEHLRKIFAVDPENLDAHEKAYNIYVAAGNTVQASEQLLNVLRLCTRREAVQRAQPYLAAILQQNPNHPEVPAFLAVLRVDESAAQVAHVESLGEDEILVDSNDEEIVVAEAPEDALARPPGDDLALAAIGSSDSDEIVDDGSSEAVISDEALVGETIVSGEAEAYVGDDATNVDGLADESLVVGTVEETTSTHLMDEPIVAGAAEDDSYTEVTSSSFLVDEPVAAEDEAIVDDPALGVALGDDEPPPTRPSMPSAELLQGAGSSHEAPGLGEDEDLPTRVAAARAMDDESFGDMELTSSGTSAYESEEPEEATTVIGAVLNVEASEDESFATDHSAVATESVHALESSEPAEESAPAEEEPASEECDEASFFLDQGLTEEAREILENVMIAFPDHVRAGELMARLEAMEAGGGATTQETEAEAASVPAVDPVSEAPAESSSAFDLAAELAEDFGDLAAEAPAPAASDDDFQYSVDEVFAEFKKGLEKVVKPEDVETHYDLGIAYKEMGLTDDALGEFSVARQGCAGTKRELDCIMMIGMLQTQRGEHAEAIKVFKEGLASEHAQGESAKALGFELAMAYEGAGENGKALYHYQRVAKLDAKYRDVSSQVERLAALTEPEEDPIAVKPKGGGPPPAAPAAAAKAPAAASAGAPKARKVGYV